MRKAESQIATIWLDSDGVAHVEFHPDSVVTLDKMKQHIAVCSELSYGKPVPVFVDSSRLKSISLEARNYVANNRCSTGITAAMALLVKSPVSRILGQLFLAYQSPQYPVKIFCCEKTALDWLKRSVI